MAIQKSILGAPSFNSYAAGAKTYGIKMSPNIGPVDQTGYAVRDRTAKARKAAVMAALKAKQAGMVN
jgi:hypothetical protein